MACLMTITLYYPLNSNLFQSLHYHQKPYIGAEHWKVLSILILIDIQQ